MAAKEVSNNEIDLQYVTFLIDGDTYGVDVSYVQEVTGLKGITKVPDSQSFMKGVLDLRGVVVPLVDMRLRFGLEEKKYDSLTSVLITTIGGRYTGMIVDAVSDVVNIPPSKIQNTQHYPVKIETDTVLGVVTTEKGIIILLDAGRVLAAGVSAS
jgi:purine-binding chemotaxis protein CheW